MDKETASTKSISPSSTLCGDDYSISSAHSVSSISIRKGHKRRNNCNGRNRRTDEAHWSKILQTCQVDKLSPPPVATSPPISPIAAIGQSVCRFFKRFNTSKKPTRRNSLEESDRPNSVSSEDSGVCSESPIPKTLPEAHRQVPTSKGKLKAHPPVKLTVHKLQTPSSSTLLTKRFQEKQHKIQKPIPLTPTTATNNGKGAGVYLSQLNVINGTPLNGGTLGVPNQYSPTGGHLPLTIASSCPLEQQRKYIPENTNLVNTWPLAHHHLTYDDEDTDDVFADDQSYINEERNVQEFTIPHENTVHEEAVGCWRNGMVYRGKWHGDVMIQTYEEDGERVSKEFWEEVKRMSKIRHENIALFMGACTSPGHLALVTGVCIGTSLYEKLHISREKTTLAAKINLSYQIVQAVAYLHAKKIIYGNMSSRNIFVEKHKATLSVINFGAVYKTKESRMERMRGQLPYIAPELLQTIDETSEPVIPCTPQADVYAFGILLHELISSTRPYRNIPANALIVQVCVGRRPPIETLPCPQTLKTLMKNCWTDQPYYRPYIHDILKELQKKDVALHNRFSSSEPDSINRLGSYML